jgi:hypothetical protein
MSVTPESIAVQSAAAESAAAGSASAQGALVQGVAGQGVAPQNSAPQNAARDNGPAQLHAAPVPASIENAAEWQTIAAQIAAETGLPTEVTPAMLTGMVGSAVALLFAADAAKDAALLRSTFADAVIAQCARTAGCLEGRQPTSVSVALVGVHLAEGHPVLRAHLTIALAQPGDDGEAAVTRQFWDIQLGGQVTVGEPNCPNCGAPIAAGGLICSHCQADVRTVVGVPLVVCRLELY